MMNKHQLGEPILKIGTHSEPILGIIVEFIDNNYDPHYKVEWTDGVTWKHNDIAITIFKETLKRFLNGQTSSR